MENINMPKAGSLENREENPDMILVLTRHAERLPSGSVTPEGLKGAAETGASLQGVGLYKPYPSTESSGRTVITGNAIAKGVGAISPPREEANLKRKEENLERKSRGLEPLPELSELYGPRKVRDIDYGVVQKEFPQHFKAAKKKIEKATLEEVEKMEGMPPVEKDAAGEFTKLTTDYSEEDQIKIAPVRQRNQPAGIKHLLDQPEIAHRMAICIAHQLLERMKVGKEYIDYRDRSRVKESEKSVKPLAGPVVPGIVGHGGFFDALLKEAGIMKMPDGSEVPIVNPASDEFGGIINPNESYRLIIKDRNNIPDRIPVEFLGAGRPKAGTVFIDMKKLCDLDEDYMAWTMTPEYQKTLQEEIIKDKARVADKYIKSINA